MRADLRPLVGVEEALEKGAEDGRVDLAPIETRGGLQEPDIAFVEAKRTAAVEQTAVEMGDVSEVELAALLHGGEELVEIVLRLLRPPRGAVEELREEAVGQELHAVREEAEHELVDEMRNLLGRAAALEAERDG